MITMGRKEKQLVQSVVEILKKQAPLTIKQEKFCNNDCVERFLKSKGDNVKKAAKLIRSCLRWRDSIGADNLVADEFSTELAEGIAYVAGNDDELRPVVIFRIKQDYLKSNSQKRFTRLLVFTLEVAVQTMAKNVEQFVLLFDASFFKSASAFMNMLVASLKIIADYYPGRLHKAFVIDPPPLFSYLWKGVRAFVENSSSTLIISSLDFEESLEYNDYTSTNYQATSLRFDSSVSSTAKHGSCSSSRFTFTVSPHFDSMKPWYLSFKDTSTSKVGPTNPPSLVAFSGPTTTNTGSHSFSSPIVSGPRGKLDVGRKNFFPSTPMPQRTQSLDPSMVHHPRTPNPSFLKSPAFFGRKDSRSHELFVPFLKLYRHPYDEIVYRSKMRPPLGGIISVESPRLKRHRHISMSQRF